MPPRREPRDKGSTARRSRAPTPSENVTPIEVPPASEGEQQHQQQQQPGQAITTDAEASSLSPSTVATSFPVAASTAQAVSPSSPIATAVTTNVRPPARNPFISSSRRPRRLTLRNATTPDNATVPQLPSANTTNGGDSLTTATAIVTSQAQISVPPPPPPPPPPTPITTSTTRGRGRGRVMSEQLMALNSANAVISAHTVAQPNSEIGSESDVAASNPPRPTRPSTSGPVTSVTADMVAGWEARTQTLAQAEAIITPSRTRSSDNVVLNLDQRSSQPFSPSLFTALSRPPRLRPLRMADVSATEAAGGTAAVVVQSEARRRARNRASLGPRTQTLLVPDFSVRSSSAGRQTRSASAAAAAVVAAAVNVVMGGDTAARESTRENAILNLGGNGSCSATPPPPTRQQSAPYPSTQRTTRARSNQGDNLSMRQPGTSSPRPHTSPLSTTAAADTVAVATSVGGDVAHLTSLTHSRGDTRTGAKRPRSEMETASNNSAPANAGYGGGAGSGGSSPPRGHASSDEGEDEVLDSGVVQLVGRRGSGGAAQVEVAVQAAPAPAAPTGAGGPAFAVTSFVCSATGVATHTFNLPAGVDPNFPDGFGGAIDIPASTRSGDTTEGSLTSAILPIGRTSTASSSLSTSSSLSATPSGSAAGTSLPPSSTTVLMAGTLAGGISAARTAVSNAARSMLYNLGASDTTASPADDTPIVPYTTATAASTSTGNGQEGAPTPAGSSTEPVSPHHDGGNVDSASDSSSSESSSGQDGSEGREKRRRVGDHEEDSSIV
ncbi:hypothetical protein BGZ47_000855 [Haplosporangium gracile]|nr:hypothetical protein BGZ47_000855 [Haplosporangium gracile]